MAHVFRVMPYHIPSLHTPREDYQDFKRLGKLEEGMLLAHLQMGILPPGLLLEWEGRAYQVWGAYETYQRLVPAGRVIHQVVPPVAVQPHDPISDQR